MNKLITRTEMLETLNTNRGKFMTVNFVKKSTGEERVMNFRQGVTRHLKGGPAAYDFSEKGLIPVWDAGKKAYRSFPIASVKWLRVGGETLWVS